MTRDASSGEKEQPRVDRRVPSEEGSASTEKGIWEASSEERLANSLPIYRLNAKRQCRSAEEEEWASLQSEDTTKMLGMAALSSKRTSDGTPSSPTTATALLVVPRSMPHAAPRTFTLLPSLLRIDRFPPAFR
jgi:hypothetical protein